MTIPNTAFFINKTFRHQDIPPIKHFMNIVLYLCPPYKIKKGIPLLLFNRKIKYKFQNKNNKQKTQVL